MMLFQSALFFQVLLLCVTGEVSGETVGTRPRGSDRGETADLGTHTESDGATLAANTAIDARGGSPQGTHHLGAATPRPPRGRRRQNQNGLDTTQVKIKKIFMFQIFFNGLLKQTSAI